MHTAMQNSFKQLDRYLESQLGQLEQTFDYEVDIESLETEELLPSSRYTDLQRVKECIGRCLSSCIVMSQCVVGILDIDSHIDDINGNSL